MTLELQIVAVGLGELQVGRDPRLVLVAYGLGSCVGVSLYDPVARVGGLAHVMLPESSGGARSPKYADQAIPLLLERLAALGGEPRRLACKLAGGARMLVGRGLEDRFQIGERNLSAVQSTLARYGLTPVGTAVGGSIGRTMHLFLESGRVIVQSAGRAEITL